MAEQGFRDNSNLITTASRVDIALNNTSDVYDASTASTAFVFNEGNAGDDTLTGFSSNDSILNYKKIYDGNGDGFIQFGANGELDIDRTSRKKAGNDQIQVTGENGPVTELRYLGSKGASTDLHVYANSATLKNLWISEFGGRANVMEGTVGNDTIDFAGGNKTLLIDNALGLNLGSDTLKNFEAGDKIVTTSKLFDNTQNDVVGLGKNLVLDVSGAAGPLSTDPKVGPGGQLDFVTPDLQKIKYTGSEVINGVTYYIYEAPDASTPPL